MRSNTAIKPAPTVLRSPSIHDGAMALGKYRPRIEARLAAWDESDFAGRLWRKDPTLWSAAPVPELADRLDWLDLPAALSARVARLTAFAEEVRHEGIDRVIWLGMGGSSLAASVFEKVLDTIPEYPHLTVLDSLHPETVIDVLDSVDVSRTLFVVASKSGTTLEPLSLFNLFWDRAARETLHPGRQFAAVTDPGTALEHLAQDRQFRDVFLAMPNLGGRYSALSEFGLLAGALVGADIRALLARAAAMACASGATVPASENPALALGAAIGGLAVAGRNKLTVFAARRFQLLANWLEQLIAESTGKSGIGIVPIVGEAESEPPVYGDDRVFVGLLSDTPESAALERALDRLSTIGHPVIRFRLNDAFDIAREMLRWEIAVAAACTVLGVNAFDQPDVELAKDLARAILRAGNRDVATTSIDAEDAIPTDDAALLARSLRAWLAESRAGSYVAIQAFLAETESTTAALQRVRQAFRDRLKLATTLDYGPRFLHSTGQLHKGGPDTGLFLQIIDKPSHDLPIPETGHSFATLVHAQALGDYRALGQRKRKVVRVLLKGPHDRALDALSTAVRHVTRAANDVDRRE